MNVRDESPRHSQFKGDGDAEPPRVSRFSRRYTALAIRFGPLCILLILWLWIFATEGAFSTGPNGKTFEADYAMFVTAARVMHSGGNAYNPARLYAAEITFLHGERITQIAARPVVRVGNPPLFFWLFRPLRELPFRGYAVAWGLMLLAVSVASFVLFLRTLGLRRLVLPSLLFMAMPPTVLAAFYGNPAPLILAAICIAVSIALRHPYLSGAFLSLAWLKPTVALPLVLLILLFHTRERMATAAGFATATAIQLALTVALAGPTVLMQWIGGLTGYSHDIGQTPQVASLAGLYIRVTSGDVRMALQLTLVLVAISITAVVWLRTRGKTPVSIASLGWLWLVWFLATPYSHIYDEILLTVPVVAFVAPDALARRTAIAAIYLLFFSLLLIQAAPGGIQLLPLPLVGVGLCLWWGGRVAPLTSGATLNAA